MTWIRRPAAVSFVLASLVTAAALAIPAMGLADLPCGPDCVSMPCQVNLVGATGGEADAVSEFSIVVRDLAQNPIANSIVLIDFAACPDLRIAAQQPFSGVTANCGGSVGAVSAITDATGIATFRIVGGARNLTGGVPGAGFRCARVYADGVLVGTLNVGAFDQNGVGGVNPVDVSVWLMDFFTGTYVGRSDFDCNQTLSPVDLSRLLSVSIAGGSTSSAAAYCF